LRQTDNTSSAAAEPIQMNEYSSVSSRRRTSSMTVTSSAALTAIEMS